MHAGAEEVVVLAVDVDSAPAHASFEALRILADPGCRDSPVASRTCRIHPRRSCGGHPHRSRRAPPTTEAPRLSELSLGFDLPGDDGLVRACWPRSSQRRRPSSSARDRPEPRSTVRSSRRLRRDPRVVPLATPLHHFGHTLGASGLLSVALAALAYRARIANALAHAADFAPDGRPLVGGPVSSRETVVVCRALGGACVACIVGPAAPDTPSIAMAAGRPPPALRDPNLRPSPRAPSLIARATPPDLLLVRLEVPLAPPPDARLAGRLLPSSILEMTPGFVAQLVAQTWGFAGPAVCLVASERAESEVTDIIRACTMAGDDVYRVDVRGQGEDRHVVWNC